MNPTLRVTMDGKVVKRLFVIAACYAGGTGTADAVAQVGSDRQLAAGPAFLMPRSRKAGPDAAPWQDASDLPVLKRRIALVLHDTPLGDALDTLGARAGLKISYSSGVIRAGTRVKLNAPEITVGAAFSALLYNASVDVLLTPSGQVAIVKRGTARIPVGTIVGRVTNAATGQAIAGAEVFLEHTRWSATSDTSGRYRLSEVDAGSYTLTARRLGYAKLSRRVTVQEGQTDTVGIVMEPVAARLDELVTTATGPRRRLDVANDVTTINADSVMQTAPIRSVTDLLETRVPGLTVQRTSGAPGDPARLRLRGVASALRGNDPIVIVDGIRVYAEQSASRSQNLARRRAGAGAVDTVTASFSNYTGATPSPLDYLDPSSIETIEVLKGPSAATLYGQDAANGVIVITTKKGRPGPPRWTASAERGRTRLAGAYPELFLRWGHGLYTNASTACPVTNPACVGDSVLTFQLLNDPALTVLDRGDRTALSLGVSGGSAALTYALTGSYRNEVGIVKLPAYEADRYQTQFGAAPPDWMRRPQHFTQWGVTSTIRAQLGAKAEVALTTSLSRADQQKSSLQDQLGTLMSTFLDRGSGTYYQKGDPIIPVTTVLTGYYERATDVATQLTNGLSLNWRPERWLTVTADAGLNLAHRADQVYYPRGLPGSGSGSSATDTVGRISDGQGRSVVSTVNLRGTVLQPLGRGFDLRVAAGANYTNTSTKDLAIGTFDLPVGATLYGSTFEFMRPGQTAAATFGYYLEPSIGNQKFNFSSGLRLDGGSAYGASVSGLSLPKFPKLGFSYLVSDEPWFPLKDLVQSFRVRVSYGKASRQPGPGDKYRLYGLPTQTLADGQTQTGVTLQTLGNTEVRPERTGEFEGGFDADLLASRLRFTVTGYRKTTDDALLSVPVAPSVSSGSSIIKNIGVIRNTGLELDVGADLVRSGPVTWTTQVQVSKDRNVVVKLGPGVAPFYVSNAAAFDGTGGIRVVPGYPLFGQWTQPILGYGDANSDGVLQPAEVQVGDTAVYVGATLPDYTAALATTVSLWRGAVTVNGVLSHDGGVAQQNTVARRLSAFSAGNMVPGTPIDEQAGTINLIGNPGLPSTDYNWTQVVSTTRLQSLSVRYAVPAAVARRLGAQTLSVAVQGSNLGLWTNYRGLDPNVNAFGTGNNVTDTGVLPQPRTWQLQVHATY